MKEVCRYCGEVKRVKSYEGIAYCKACAKLMSVNIKNKAPKVSKQQSFHQSIQNDHVKQNTKSIKDLQWTPTPAVVEAEPPEPEHEPFDFDKTSHANGFQGFIVDNKLWMPRFKESTLKLLKAWMILAGISLVTLIPAWSIAFARFFSLLLCGILFALWVLGEVIKKASLFTCEGVLKKHPSIIDTPGSQKIQYNLLVGKTHVVTSNRSHLYHLGQDCQVIYAFGSKNRIVHVAHGEKWSWLHKLSLQLNCYRIVFYALTAATPLIWLLSFFNANWYFMWLSLSAIALVILFVLTWHSDLSEVKKKQAVLESVWLKSFKVPFVYREQVSKKIILSLTPQEVPTKIAFEGLFWADQPFLLRVLTCEELQLLAKEKTENKEKIKDKENTTHHLDVGDTPTMDQSIATLSDTIVNLYQDRKWSCSEVTLRAVNQKYKLGLDEKALQMMAGFSGGMMREDVCGLVVASVAAISARYSQGSAHESPELKRVLGVYFEAFDQAFETIVCHEIKMKHRDHEHGSCLPVILKNADILEDCLREGVNHDQS